MGDGIEVEVFADGRSVGTARAVLWSRREPVPGIDDDPGRGVWGGTLYGIMLVGAPPPDLVRLVADDGREGEVMVLGQYVAAQTVEVRGTGGEGVLPFG